MEQPTHGPWGWESWAAELGEAGGCLRRSGGWCDCLGPRETELHCQCGSQIERKPEREGGGVPGLGERGMDGGMDAGRKSDGEHREEGGGSTEMETERGKDRRREGLSHQCVYISTYGPLNFLFLLQTTIE